MICRSRGTPPPLENGSFPGRAVPEMEEKHDNGNKFFKIIHSQIIRDRKLAIPMKFLGKFAKDLSDFAILKAPRGPTWRVELKKGHRGDVWFRKGWQDFVDYHSISPTDFVMFRYDGNSQFHVLIFDVSGSEIGYRVSPPDNFQEHDISHRRRSSINTKVKDIVKQEQLEDFDVLPISESFMNQKSSTAKPVTGNVYSRKRSSTAQEINVSPAMQAAKEFKSENPSFTVPIAPANVKQLFMPVPSTFGKRLLQINTRDWIKVRVSDGRSWFIKCFFSKTVNQFRLSKGLAAFFGENDVKTGDVCVFELIIEDDAPILHAHIFHWVRPAGCSATLDVFSSTLI